MALLRVLGAGYFQGNMLSTQIWTEQADLERLATDWDRILSSCTRHVRGPDATCSFVWATALRQTLLKGAQLRVLVVSSGSEVVAIVPTYLHVAAAIPFNKRELRIVNEAHGGRRGLLIMGDDPDIAEFALDRLRQEFPCWDLLQLGAVMDTPSHGALMRATRQASLRARSLAVHQSPYIELAGSWEAMMRALPKKTRWTIRKGERDLSSRGGIEYEQFTDAAAVSSLMAAIHAVESRSWKQGAGTSLIAQSHQLEFFDAFARLAADCGVLSGHILRVASQPIAYILGVVGADDVFLDLKESFDASYADCSPGHVLKRFAVESLIAKGIRTYDFMGRCEPFKMRWTDKTYRCETIALYNRTLRGSICYLRSGLARRSAMEGSTTVDTGEPIAR